MGNVDHSEEATFGLGRPVNRVEGEHKVCGKATYAAEHSLQEKPLVGWIVESTIAKGRIEAIDTSVAEASDGVHLVMTYQNAPEQRPFGEPEDEGRFTQSRAMLANEKVRYHGFPVALVVAETLAQARHAAKQISLQYAEEEAVLTCTDDAEETPESLDGGMEPDAKAGSFAEQWSASPVKVEATFTTPNQVSAAMEPHAAIVKWDGSTLDVLMSVQIVSSAVEALANTLKLEPSQIRVRSPYIGGGFGSKLGVHNETILASLAAIQLKRAVKVVQSRRNVFSNAPHRGSSIQKVQLGADQQGVIKAIAHHSYMPVARDYDFAEPSGAGARVTYAADAITSTHRVKQVDMPIIDSTRAPGDAIGSLAFESAIDELAHALKMDPLELRLKNIPSQHPVSGKPFASHDLAACLKEGAEKFGWSKGPGAPSSDRKKRGIGLASAVRFNTLVQSEASLTLTDQGVFEVRTDMTDIGTGTYTILTQIVADSFGVSAEKVRVFLGDSKFPASSGSGGSFGAGSSGSSVLEACNAMKSKLLALAGGDGADTTARWNDGNVSIGTGETGTGEISLAALAAEQGGSLEIKGAIKAGEEHEQFEQNSYGAHFAEVEVDMDTAEVRVTRLLGVFSAGRILNPKTAASQLKGGMIWGVSYALFEELMLDDRYGAFMNRDFAEYHVPVSRDIPDIGIYFRECPDYKSNPLGSKGIGELGIAGAGAAVANAIFAATGVRVRDFPITLDKILAGLPN